MTSNPVFDVAIAAFTLGGLYPLLLMYVSLEPYPRSSFFQRHRWAFLWIFVLGVSIVKITADVVSGDASAIDREILIYVHSHMPGALLEMCKAITLSGSSWVLVPLTVVATILLLYWRRRFEAVLLAVSMTSSLVLIYLIKAVVGRARPDLWPAHWYWGSSFPSGHTLGVAAFATAVVFVLGRVWPASRVWAPICALLWIALVAFSRLALGVHWPTDVFVAACIGASLPLTLNLLLVFNSTSAIRRREHESKYQE